MDSFFTDAFAAMTAEEKEQFYKTVILQDEADYAKQLRQRYYATKLKHMGQGVEIGAGVKIVNPQYISLGDGVKIRDGVTIIMSSHYAEDIEALCDTVCEMDCGKLTKLRGFDEENVS